MVEALAPNRPNHALDVGPLPGRTRRREHFLDAQIPDLLGEAGPDDAIPIEEKISRHLLKRERLSQLLSGPLGRRMRGDVEMHDPLAVVSQHQEHVQHLKANGRKREEVDRNRGLPVVFQEGPPCLRRRIPTADHVFAHAGLADVNAELEEFTVDARSAQSGFSRLIFRISLRTSFDTGGRPRWPRRTFQVQNSRNPLRCQAMTVPGLTMQRAERHSAEAPPKPSPQEPVEPVQSWLFDRALHHAKLVAESQDL